MGIRSVELEIEEEEEVMHAPLGMRMLESGQ